MNADSHVSRRRTLGGVLVTLATTGCALLAPQAERWTPPPVGATWEVAQRNTGSYGRDVQLQLTRQDGTWAGQPAILFPNSQGTTIVTARDGHWHAVLGRDGQPMMTWDPPLGFHYPLAVGKSWVTPYRLTLGASGRTLAYDLSCRVEGHEKVSVRAGTFDTFKVACTTTIGNEETYWTEPDLGVFVKTRLLRTDKSPFGPGTQEAELVSVPTLRR